MYQHDETQLMVHVAKLYYENQLNQEEIAARIGLTRQKVSRLLISARTRGITKTVIVDPFSKDLDTVTELKERFNLHEVELLPGEMLENNQLRTGMGLIAAEHLQRSLEDNQNVGIGWGRSVFETVGLLPKNQQKHIHVVPLIGGMGDMSQYFQVNEFARLLANAFDGSYRHLYAPAFIEKAAILDNFLKTQEIIQITELWNRLHTAVIGIGHVEFQKNSSMYFANHMTQRSLAHLEAQGAVGDICARFFDVRGIQIPSKTGVVGISLDQLKTVPEIIAIAGGVEKTKAILGALRGGFVKTLITDCVTARAVIAEDRKGGGGEGN